MGESDFTKDTNQDNPGQKPWQSQEPLSLRPEMEKAPKTSRSAQAIYFSLTSVFYLFSHTGISVPFVDLASAAGITHAIRSRRSELFLQESRYSQLNHGNEGNGWPTVPSALWEKARIFAANHNSKSSKNAKIDTLNRDPCCFTFAGGHNRCTLQRRKWYSRLKLAVLSQEVRVFLLTNVG